MSRIDLSHLHATTLVDEGEAIARCLTQANLSAVARAAISKRASAWVAHLRAHGEATLMEAFLSEYGLSTEEGIALMCLAEALLRVPDSETVDDLIADKITSSDWDAHSGHASSVLVNASTWALMLTGSVLSDAEDAGVLSTLRSLIRRVGEPVIRTAVSRAMRELGEQFVLGENIRRALARGQRWQAQGHTFSFDMLGEGARTDADARRYHLAYADAITEIARYADQDVRANPGISVKLSALHPRFEATHRPHYFDQLLARTRALAVLAAGSNIGLNIDAEESDRLVPTLEIVEALLDEPALAGWDGLGVVVQAYGRRCLDTINWLHEQAETRGRRIMVRLVKGAYWDTEIKRAQVLGVESYPVYTRKAHTDVAYIAAARQLLAARDHIYPQFASHNAHTLAAVMHLAEDVPAEAFEIQRLHGMGEALHAHVYAEHGVRSRIYAPVGVHRDLLAYLVRRLLENGANSSFVHQIVDDRVPAAQVAADPFAQVDINSAHNIRLRTPPSLFSDRRNAIGWDLTNGQTLAELLMQRESVDHPPLATEETTDAGVQQAFGQLADARLWAHSARVTALLRAADLFEANVGGFLDLLGREAHKTINDALLELREAVDFLRFYATQSERLEGEALGIVACIAPWNFPLAIFTGQMAAALAAGNRVVTKPAEQTPAVAAFAVALLHEAGVPEDQLQLVIGDGRRVGNALTGHPATSGVVFTGSLPTAQAIHRNMAAHAAPNAPLIAETGGINCMIVDSTALPEQAARDIIASAFQSAGQRCSALRVLYLQKDIAERFLTMITGAMDALVVGNPLRPDADIGPVIDATAFERIERYLARCNVLHRSPVADALPNMIAPALVQVRGVEDVPEEIFGPVLHVATYRPQDLERIVARINASGYGLTFGVHTRLDDRVQWLVDSLHVGNIYVNRNQIGAVVESQPFGGEGLSGTGPKAGGYHYLPRLQRSAGAPLEECEPGGRAIGARRLNAAVKALEGARAPELAPPPSDRALPSMRLLTPGPTGERNDLSLHPRGTALCLGHSDADAILQARCALACGNAVILCSNASDAIRQAVEQWQADGLPVIALEGFPSARALTAMKGVETVAFRGDEQTTRMIRTALAARPGHILRYSSEAWEPMAYLAERHVATDTTAAGGNTSLMSGTEERGAKITD